ncbi:zinc finger protein [Holotrichia oblita]|uniref:Zinc finger protein n=1 Tax=Holotrichia oblita TaxID=644536 RepID=A0ACB9SMX2_HOLOL|nr:zinc finger protein [Holotrichia oblita]
MSSNTDVSYNETENACVVCFKNVDIYSVGVCDHPVCYECSTRMRVLCKQNECPICRQDMPKVRLCRRCYTRSELALHRRKGDADNTSHRGHPLCEFCDVRYMDNDELFRHLRRDHLFCHFCDADGKHQYYNSYADLRKHFLEDHYVCEEGDCKNEQFTSVFRSDIDLRAHITNVHSKHMSKSATKQARTLELEFRFRGRRQQQGNDGSDDLEGAVGYENYNMEPGGNRNGQQNQKPFVNPINSADFPSLGNVTEVPQTRATSSVTFTKISSKPFRAEDFPSLGSRPGTARSSNVTITTSSKIAGTKGVVSGKAPEVTIQASRRPQHLEINQQNFPTLGGATPGNSTVRFSISNNTQDRPQSSRPNVSIHVSNQADVAITTRITTAPTSTQQPRPKSSEAFPALSSAPIREAQWVLQKPKKHVESAKVSKVAPAPQLPPSNLDFPVLTKTIKSESKTKKRSSVTMPVSNSWVNLNSFNIEANNSAKNSKKDANKGVNNDNNVNSDRKTTERTSSALNNKVSDKSGDNSNRNKKKKHKSTDKTSSHHENGENEFNNKDKIQNLDNLESDLSKNGIVKKISQLQIDTFNHQHKENGLPEDFPVLGDKKPPPGFNVKPPPGFDNCNALLPSNDLTFTNSSGQSYSILPTSYEYHLPPNFEIRNKKLIDSLMNLGNKDDEIREFKLYSDLFRKGSYSAKNYYEHCQSFLGDDFDRVFPELLALLPDIAKQQDLYRVHAKKDLEVCKTCNQIVLYRDLRSHLSNHTLENSFPVLEHPVEPVNNYWKK